MSRENRGGRIRGAVTSAAIAALVAIGCGSDPASGAPGGPSPSATDTTVPTTVGFHFTTGKFDIQPGDTFECFYTDTITQEQLNVSFAEGKQGPGGHHLVVYYTDQKVPPSHHPCTDVEMIGLHQIAGAGDGKEGVVGLPEGYASRVPAGKQLVVQVHYIRTEDGPLTVEDEITLHTVPTEKVKAFANSFVLNDGNFRLPPRSAPASASECVVPDDFDVLLVLGHMHEWGSHYKLERVDEAGVAQETLYETDWDPLYASHPPISRFDPTKPLKLTKGMRLRQTCNWKNVEDHEMAFPREMCVMFTYYIPDKGFIVCDTEAVKGVQP